MSIKFGVCEFCLPCNGTLAIRMAGDAGYEGIQIGDMGGAAQNYPFLSPYIQHQYLQEAEDNHIVLQAMHLQTLFNSRYMMEPQESLHGETARESLKNAAIACRQMGIPVIMITGTMIANKEQYDNFSSSLKYGLEVCMDQGIQLVMETDLPPVQFIELRERTGSDLKLCFDTMNPTVYGIGRPFELIKEFGIDKIDHFHVKDCVENERGYFTRYTTPYRLIGQGNSGFSSCAEVIRNLNYEGWVISETFYCSKNFKGRDFIDLAREDVKMLQSVLGS